VSPNEYAVGIGGFLITSLYVIILAFLWRVISAKLANSDSPTAVTIGSAMGSTL
jgi:hypothetical protein